MILVYCMHTITLSAGEPVPAEGSVRPHQAAVCTSAENTLSSSIDIRPGRTLTSRTARRVCKV